MAEPLSMDFRERIVEDCEAEERVAVVAEKYRVSRKTIYNLLRLKRETGSVAPRPGQPGRNPKLDPQREKIEDALQENPDLTLEGMICQLSLCISISALTGSLGHHAQKKSPELPSRRGLTSARNAAGGQS